MAVQSDSPTRPGGPCRVALGRGLVAGSCQPGLREPGAVRIALEVVLIFGLGLQERPGLADLGRDLGQKPAASTTAIVSSATLRCSSVV